VEGTGSVVTSGEDISMQQHQITVMGKQIRLRSDSDPERIQAVAEYVNGKIDGIADGPKTGTAAQQVLVLAALSMADEIFEVRAQHDALRERIREHSRSLLDRMGERA
jgi:cell division protein ZapA (FtsZ GTPase activity inhibitor)